MSGIDLRIQIDGIDELLHRFNRVLAAETRAAPMMRLRDKLVERLSAYPPPPPTSTYERTGDLGRGWTEDGVRVDASGTNQYADQVSIELQNPVSYSPWVQDTVMQAGVHRGRWQTTQDAIDAETGPFMRDLSDSVGRAFGTG